MSKNKSFVYPTFSVIKSFLSVQIQANCRFPGDISHGLKIGNNYKHGKTVRYSCNAGFTLEGEAEVTCEEGTWNTDTPTCKGTFLSLHEFVFREIYLVACD